MRIGVAATTVAICLVSHLGASAGPQSGGPMPSMVGLASGDGYSWVSESALLDRRGRFRSDELRAMGVNSRWLEYLERARRGEPVPELGAAPRSGCLPLHQFVWPMESLRWRVTRLS